MKESAAEKLLGVIVSNDLSWRTHLHGNKMTGKDKITGLITKLSQRVGMLKRLSKVMPKNKFKNVSEGIFNSKLIYCLQLFGSVWGVPNFDEDSQPLPKTIIVDFNAFKTEFYVSKQDCHKTLL